MTASTARPPISKAHSAPGICTIPPSLSPRGTVPNPAAHENLLPPSCWGCFSASSQATGSKESTKLRSLQPQHTPCCPTVCPQWAALTRVLRHVVLELVHPLALVAAVRAEVFPLLLVDPHVVLGTGQEGRVRVRLCPHPGNVQRFGVPARGSKTTLISQTAWDKEGCLLAWQTLGRGDPQQGQDKTPILRGVDGMGLSPRLGT